MTIKSVKNKRLTPPPIPEQEQRVYVKTDEMNPEKIKIYKEDLQRARMAITSAENALQRTRLEKQIFLTGTPDDVDRLFQDDLDEALENQRIFYDISVHTDMIPCFKELGVDVDKVMSHSIYGTDPVKSTPGHPVSVDPNNRDAACFERIRAAAGFIQDINRYRAKLGLSQLMVSPNGMARAMDEANRKARFMKRPRHREDEQLIEFCRYDLMPTRDMVGQIYLNKPEWKKISDPFATTISVGKSSWNQNEIGDTWIIIVGKEEPEDMMDFEYLWAVLASYNHRRDMAKDSYDRQVEALTSRYNRLKNTFYDPETRPDTINYYDRLEAQILEDLRIRKNRKSECETRLKNAAPGEIDNLPPMQVLLSSPEYASEFVKKSAAELIQKAMPKEPEENEWSGFSFDE